MHARSTRLIAALASFVFVPLAARSQSDPALKLSTTNSTAAAEFRAGVGDFQNVSFESATAHFKAAVDADPNFGLARVLYAGIGPLTGAPQETELNRGVVDAAFMPLVQQEHRFSVVGDFAKQSQQVDAY